MSWSITLGRIAGSEIRIHLTFFLLLLWIGIIHLQTDGVEGAIEAIAFICAVFACVALHELGHAIAAKRYGIKTPDITLLPIGGLARLERMPENPGQEIVIAVAGPMVNVVIAAILILVLGARFDAETFQTIENPAADFAARLAAVNIFLVLFNAIPAFPMDGGRVFRALLAMRLGRVNATRVAARTGQALAFGFGFLGLMAGNPILVFIAIFVYLAAGAEADDVEMTAVGRAMPVDDAMITSFETLSARDTVEAAADALIRTTQHEFPVVDGAGAPRGIITRNAIIEAMRTNAANAPALDWLVEIPSVHRGETLARAITAMREKAAPAVAVTDKDNRLLGYVTPENLSELMMVHTEKKPPSGGTSSVPQVKKREA